MYKEFIKDWLLNNQSKVYSIIVKQYANQLTELNPTLFRKWLAKEIEIDEEKINLSSLNSALARFRKNHKVQEKKGGKNLTSSPNAMVSKIDNSAFSFSSVNDLSTNPRSHEL